MCAKPCCLDIILVIEAMIQVEYCLLMFLTSVSERCLAEIVFFLDYFAVVIFN